MDKKPRQFFARNQRMFFFLRPYLIHFSLCILILGIHLAILYSGRLERIEHLFLDYFLRQRPPITVNSDIVLIDINEESLQAIGAWPWPWHYYAPMIDLLESWGARSIVFDFILKEPQASFENQDFQKALERTQNIYLPVLYDVKPTKKYWIHSLPLDISPQTGEKAWTHSPAELEKYAKSLGHINAEPDADGLLRRIKPFLGEEEAYPYLAIKVAYDFLNRPLENFQDIHLPLDYRGNFLINWSGDESRFSRFSFADLIRSFQAVKQGMAPVIASDRIKNKICIIGLAAKDKASLYVTPLASGYASSGIPAHVINSILTGQYLYPVSPRLQGVCLLVLGLLISYFFVRLRNVFSFVLGLGIAGGWIILSFFLFSFFGIWCYVFQPLLLILSLFIFSTIYSIVMATREHRRLFHLATQDGLTGLYIIRYFREILNRVVEEAGLTKENIALILIDVDNFKAINDTHGHPAGDMVLKKVAKTIHTVLKARHLAHPFDMAARYGGEEFIILLRHTKMEEAVRHVAEKMREAIAAAAFEWEHQKIPVTISLGVAHRRSGENIPDLMVRRADEALYQAKRNGKNRVCAEASQ